MFNLISPQPGPGYIHQFRCGTTDQYPKITVCQAFFDTSLWQDELFLTSVIVFPDALLKAARKRKAEYFAGRFCCQRLLAAHGVHTPVLSHPDRSPAWPGGFCGSISHTQNQAVVVLAPVNLGISPGVDTETLAPRIMRETAAMFTSPPERITLQQCALEWEQALLVTFSAKEALFKSLYPQVKRYLDFDCAEISELNTDLCTVTLRLTQPLSAALPAGYRFYGKWQFAGNVVTTCFLPQIHLPDTDNLYSIMPE